MKPKKALFVSIAFLILLLLLTGCRRFKETSSQPPGISMASQALSSGDASSVMSSTPTSSNSGPSDSKEIDDTLDQILSELQGLDSLYNQLDDVSDADLND